MNVFNELINWGNERLITIQPYDKNGFIVNILSELAENIASTDEQGIIDSLCDIVVFSVTELPKLDVTLETITQCHSVALLKHLSENEVSDVNFKDNIILDLNQIIENKESASVVIFRLIDRCYGEINAMGYDIEKSMYETFLEINSRKGEWNDEVKKWKKFTDDHHKSLWVSADYSKCLKI